jgi:phosphoglycolate phosphatase
MHTPGTEPGPAFQAVLFDFDGTLADSYPAITASVNHVRGLYGLAPLTEAEVRPHVGRGPAALLAATVGHGGPADVAAYKAHHPLVLRTGTRLMPGAAEAVRSLHGHGLRLGVCSNKPVAFTRELLDYLGIADYFAVVLGPEDVAHPKPAPDMLKVALSRLGVTAAAVLYVGDMVVDIDCARGAGLVVWVVPTGSDDVAALERGRPDRLLRDLSELSARLTAGNTEV